MLQTELEARRRLTQETRQLQRSSNSTRPIQDKRELVNWPMVSLQKGPLDDIDIEDIGSNLNVCPMAPVNLSERPPFNRATAVAMIVRSFSPSEMWKSPNKYRQIHLQ